MPIEVRPIGDEELEAWTETITIGFHANHSIADSAAFQREVFGDFIRAVAAYEDGKIVGTFQNFPAELTMAAQDCVRVNAISGVTVLPTHHRRGVLTQMMTRDLTEARERGDAAAILLASEYPIYGRFGFGPATERAEYTIETSYAQFTRPISRRIDLVTPERLRQVLPPIFDRFRRGYPGQIDRRPETSWDARVGLRQSPYQPDRPVRGALALGEAGEVDGYVLFRFDDVRQPYRQSGIVEVNELIALSQAAYVSLWRFCCEMDLIGEAKFSGRRVHEPIAWVLTNPRTAMQLTRRTDFLWVRPLDVPALLQARRPAVDVRVVVEIDDPLGLSGGRFKVEAGPRGATCVPTQQTADVRMGISTLGALSLGGPKVHTLAYAGLIEGDLVGSEHLFASDTDPWCSTFF